MTHRQFFEDALMGRELQVLTAVGLDRNMLDLQWAGDSSVLAMAMTVCGYTRETRQSWQRAQEQGTRDSSRSSPCWGPTCTRWM